jgi:hypothetical protein
MNNSCSRENENCNEANELAGQKILLAAIETYGNTPTKANCIAYLNAVDNYISIIDICPQHVAAANSWKSIRPSIVLDCN